MNEMKGSREQEIERSREQEIIAGAGGAHDFEFKWHKMDENRYLQKRKLFLRTTNLITTETGLSFSLF